MELEQFPSGVIFLALVTHQPLAMDLIEVLSKLREILKLRLANTACTFSLFVICFPLLFLGSLQNFQGLSHLISPHRIQKDISLQNRLLNTPPLL